MKNYGIQSIESVNLIQSIENVTSMEVVSREYAFMNMTFDFFHIRSCIIIDAKCVATNYYWYFYLPFKISLYHIYTIIPIYIYIYMNFGLCFKQEEILTEVIMFQWILLWYILKHIDKLDKRIILYSFTLRRLLNGNFI